MIGTDELMALVVMKNGHAQTIRYLGYATLESWEYDRLDSLAKQNGCSLVLTSMEEDDFGSLYMSMQYDIQKAKQCTPSIT